MGKAGLRRGIVTAASTCIFFTPPLFSPGFRGARPGARKDATHDPPGSRLLLGVRSLDRDGSRPARRATSQGPAIGPGGAAAGAAAPGPTRRFRAGPGRESPPPDARRPVSAAASRRAGEGKIHGQRGSGIGRVRGQAIRPGGDPVLGGDAGPGNPDRGPARRVGLLPPARRWNSAEQRTAGRLDGRRPRPRGRGRGPDRLAADDGVREPAAGRDPTADLVQRRPRRRGRCGLGGDRGEVFPGPLPN